MALPRRRHAIAGPGLSLLTEAGTAEVEVLLVEAVPKLELRIGSRHQRGATLHASTHRVFFGDVVALRHPFVQDLGLVVNDLQRHGLTHRWSMNTRKR